MVVSLIPGHAGRIARRQIAFRRKLLYSLITTSIFVVAAELTCRFLTSAFWPVYSCASIRDTMTPFILADEVGDNKSQRRPRESIHPYFGYVSTPGLGMSEQSYPVTPLRLISQVGPGVRPEWMDLRANNWGFWSPYNMPYHRQPDDYVVVLLGGSVAQWLAIQGGPTLTAELTRQVPELAAKNIVILNCALNGFKQPQQVMVMTYLLVHGVNRTS